MAGTEAVAIPTVQLPGGVEAPQLGLGTWQLRGEPCERAVAQALELGYRHIDTAEGYGNEEVIGRAIAGTDRSALFLTSKVWREHLRPDDLRASCDASLRRLGTDYLDLLLIHWPNSGIAIGETVEGFEALREAGRIRAWGVSNFTPRHLEELSERDDVATNQVELHPYFRQDDLVSACDGMRIPVTAYSPLAKGRVVSDPVLQRIAGRHGATPAQVALRWAAQRGHLVIPKASSRGHLEENLRAFEIRLTDEEMAEIDARPQGERLVDGDWSEF